MKAFELDELLVPYRTEWSWGQGFGDTGYAPMYRPSLDAIHQKYHNHGPRIFEDTEGYTQTSSGFVLPPGYDAFGHDNRAGKNPEQLDPEFPTTLEGQPRLPQELVEHFRWRGWALDQHDRPCHPHATELISWLGLGTGIGYGYFYGEYPVVDAVLVDDRAVLLTKRDEEGAIFTERTVVGEAVNSLVGGYCIPTDFGVMPEQWKAGSRPLHTGGIFEMAQAMRRGLQGAARRLLKLKGGITIAADTPMTIVRGIRPTNWRYTWNFWNVVYTLRIYVKDASRNLPPANGARWAPFTEFGSAPRDMILDQQRGLVAALDD